MKKILFLVIFFLLFLFIFFKSNTWETYRMRETRRGIGYVVIKHRLHWDRFYNYIKNIPKRIIESDIFKPFPIK